MRSRPAASAAHGDEPAQPNFWRWAWESTAPSLGYVLVGLGLLALFLGWFGVSGTELVAKQLPYLASGGLLGIALIALGSRYLLIQDLRRDSGRLDRLETMVLELHATLLSRTDAPTPRQREERARANGRRPDGGATEQGLQVLPGGQTYHAAGCPMLEGKDTAQPIAATAAAKRGLTPCPLCEPAPVGASV